MKDSQLLASLVLLVCFPCNNKAIKPSSIELIVRLVDFSKFQNQNIIILTDDSAPRNASNNFGDLQFNNAAFTWSRDIEWRNYTSQTLASGPTLAFASFRNWSATLDFLNEVQLLYTEANVAREWLPVFVILVEFQSKAQLELVEPLAVKFIISSNVYFMFWEHRDGAPDIRHFIEIYSIKNVSIVHHLNVTKNVATSQGDKSKLALDVILEGKTVRRLNFERVVIIGLNVDDPGYPDSTKYRHDGTSNKTEFEGGFEVKEYWYLRDALNFSEQAAAWPTYLRQAPNGSLTGLAIPINEGSVDVNIGYTEFLEYRVTAPNGITFLHPTFHNEILCFFKQPAASSIRDVFINTFSPYMWMALFATWIVIVLSLMGSIQLLNWADRHSDSGKDLEFYHEIWIWAVGAICQQGWHTSPISTSTKMMFLLGVVTGLLLYIAYSAALVALLSVEVIPVRAFHDLLTYEFDIRSDNHIPTSKFVVNTLENSGVIKKLPNDERNVDVLEIVPRMLKKEVAVVSFTDAFYQVLLQRYDANFLCTKLSKVPFSRRPAVSSMFVKRGSYLREYLNVKIALMKERGVLHRLRGHYIDATAIKCSESSGGFNQKLGSKDVFTAYIILLAGIFISLTSIVLERAAFNKKGRCCARGSKDSFLENQIFQKSKLPSTGTSRQ